MREPKRLAHKQAERNRARAMKQWAWDDDEDVAEPVFAAVEFGRDSDADAAVFTMSYRPYTS